MPCPWCDHMTRFSERGHSEWHCCQACGAPYLPIEHFSKWQVPAVVVEHRLSFLAVCLVAAGVFLSSLAAAVACLFSLMPRG